MRGPAEPRASVLECGCPLPLSLVTVSPVLRITSQPPFSALASILRTCLRSKASQLLYQNTVKCVGRRNRAPASWSAAVLCRFLWPRFHRFLASHRNNLFPPLLQFSGPLPSKASHTPPSKRREM